MAMAEERYKNGAQNLCDFIGLVPSKKRKRRTSFTPQALEILNEYFERSTHPTGQLHCHYSERKCAENLLYYAHKLDAQHINIKWQAWL